MSIQHLILYLILAGCAVYIAHRLYLLLKCGRTGCEGCAFYAKCKRQQKKHP